jgi:hypothetical protein
MEGFVASGHDHYRLLLNFRDELQRVRNDENSREAFRRSGKPGLGPLKMDVRKRLLDELLQLQDALGEQLIDPIQVSEIRKIWLADATSDIFSTATSLSSLNNAMTAEVYSTGLKRFAPSVLEADRFGMFVQAGPLFLTGESLKLLSQRIVVGDHLLFAMKDGPVRGRLVFPIEDTEVARVGNDRSRQRRMGIGFEVGVRQVRDLRLVS